MRASPWFVVLGLLTWLAELALAQPPGGGPTGPQRPRQGGCAVGWDTLLVLGGVLVACFVAGAIAQIRKRRAK